MTRLIPTVIMCFAMFGAVAQEAQPLTPPTLQAICGYKWREHLAADPSAPRGWAAFTEYRRTVCRSPSPAGSRPPASAFRTAAPIPADVLRVIDGDTFEARVHVWPGLDVTTKVRLRGIDAAELRARCPAERTKAEAARDALMEILALAQGAVGVYDISIDKYGGRVVADAATRSTANVSAELLKRGQARFYAGGHREGWCP
jgi:endonuclease YncB( thermonuclease family)